MWSNLNILLVPSGVAFHNHNRDSNQVFYALGDGNLHPLPAPVELHLYCSFDASLDMHANRRKENIVPQGAC